MSTDPLAPGPHVPGSPPKSGGGKIWLTLALGCGGIILLVCCGVGGFAFYTYKSAIQIATAPADIEQQEARIAEIEVPQSLTAKQAITVKVPFGGQEFMSMVVYGAPGQDSSLVLMQMGQIGAADPAQLQSQMEVQMSQQGKQMKNLTVGESHEVEVEINGQPATFRIQKAEDQQTNQEFVQVQGTFQGKGGAAMLWGQFKAESFSEDDAEKLVRSIK